jgi:transposase InsO family protein
MPFEDQTKMDQRHEFVLRANAPGANRRELCRAFGITPRTGYKWLKRYEEKGVAGLEELGRGPSRGRSPLQCSAEVAVEVLAIRKSQPTWGPKKIGRVLERSWPKEEVPSSRTICRILERAGVASPRRRKRRKGTGPSHEPEVVVEGPNDLWTVDFKGWWRTKDGKRCEPLTVRDAHSRFVLCIELVEEPSIEVVKAIFERLFKDYGMPRAIQSDNGTPFVSTTSLGGLTKLSAWWVVLGIEVVRSRVGCPQDNGGHERMHRDMAEELERNPAWSRAQQQKHCDRWREDFNHYRPHEALGLETPGSVYRRSPRVYPQAPPEVVYPKTMETRRVTRCGTVRYAGFQRSLSQALAGYDVGFEYLGEHRFRVWFAGLCLGTGMLPWHAPLRPAETPVVEAA